MAKILVSLISAQTIPNVLMIKELSVINRHIFISTELMEKKKNSDWVIQGSGIPEENVRKIVVIEDSLSDIEEKLKTIKSEDEDEFYVNLTGGTKIMSIGVYNFFKRKPNKIYYIPIGKNIYRKIFPESEDKDCDIKYRIGVIEYLRSYGVEVLNPDKLNTTVKNSEFAEQFYQAYSGFTSPDYEILNRLRAVRDKKKILIKDIKNLKDFLDRLNFYPALSDSLNRKEIEYLTGGWFEELVYFRIKNHLKSDDDDAAIGLNIKIKWQNVENEFDVMFAIDNSLHVVECKTSVYNSVSEKNIINETLYKLGALKKDFGLNVKSYLFTLSKLGDKKNYIRQFDLERAKLLNINVVDKEMFENPIEICIWQNLK